MSSTPTPESGNRKRGRSVFDTVLHSLLWILVVSWVFFTGWRLFGTETSWPVVVGIAYTPYVAAGIVIPILLAILLKALRRLTLLVLCACALLVVFIPRVMSDSQRTVDGPQLRVATVNLLGGAADSQDVVDLVKDNRIDVLSVQELTPDQVEDLAQAGLDELLPEQLLKPEADSAAGTGIYSKHPLEEDEELGVDGRFWMPGATIDLPGAVDLEFVAVHPTAPVSPSHIDEWRADLAALPSAGGEDSARVLAGDFNATLDHKALRSLIATGYVDAADATGSGWTGTWPMDKKAVPKVTLDHVLAGQNIAVDSYDTHDVEGSDHRAVSATLVLPSQQR